MKQFVRSPTRGDRILDLVLTNLPQTYDKNGVEILPAFGLSDHNVALLHPKVRSGQEGLSGKVITKRYTRISRKLELGRYLNSINWSIVDSLENCEDKLELMTNLIINGLNHIIRIERVKVHVNDCPWITPSFKELIRSLSQVSKFNQSRTENSAQKILHFKCQSTKTSQC